MCSGNNTIFESALAVKACVATLSENEVSSRIQMLVPRIVLLCVLTNSIGALLRSRLPLSLQISTSLLLSGRSLDFLQDSFLITTADEGSPRIKSTKAVLSRLGLDKIKLKKFAVDHEDKVRGCYTSHISVLREVSHAMQKANRDRYHVLVLEDNIDLAYKDRTNHAVLMTLQCIGSFLNSSAVTCDVLHLGYMMYVPGLRARSMRQEGHPGIVQLFSTSNATAIGTSAYIISAEGVQKLLQYDAAQGGYIPGKAIPNVMAEVFPDSRYALYPMLLHRSRSVPSIVNPQLDALRKVVFRPALRAAWESLLVRTGLETNQLFPLALSAAAVTPLLALSAAALVQGATSR